MIIQSLGSDLLLIAQSDHAALAARIMNAWRADGFPERPKRARVLEATRQHDIGWQEVDAAPSVNPESGMPYDVINVPVDVRQGAWPRALDRLAPEDRYVAALVAQHALTVYSRFMQAPEWKEFFAEMERRRADLLAALGLERETFLQDYAIVGIGDRCSLVFCYGWQEPNLIGGYRVKLHGGAMRGETCLEITPDPFEGAVVPLDVPAWRVPARRYASDADLRDTVARAPIVHLTGVARGSLR